MAHIDNFDLAAERLLKFDNKGEFYIVEALCRPKKDGASTLLGTTNNHTRMVKMWTFYSVEDFQKMRPEIVSVCDANNARGYLVASRRTTYSAMKSIMQDALKSLDDEKVNFNRFLTSALCGHHDSPHKRWVFDIDDDDPYLLDWIRNHLLPDGETEVTQDWFVKGVLSVYDECVFRVKKCRSGVKEDVVVVPTAHGCHIVTPPFNRYECPKIGIDSKMEPLNENWLKEDAMTLLYTPQKGKANVEED